MTVAEFPVPQRQTDVEPERLAVCEAIGVLDVEGRRFRFLASGEKPEEVGWTITGTIDHVEFSPAQGILRLWSGLHHIEWKWDERDKKWGPATYVTGIHMGRKGTMDLD